MNIIAESLTDNIDILDTYEPYYNEGDYGELKLYVERPLIQDEMEQLESQIRSQGAILTTPIQQDSRIVSIKFQKAIAPLLIIGLAVAGVVVAGAGLVGWQLFKNPFGIPWWVWAVGGGALLYLILRKPAKQAAGFAIQAGKVYVTKKSLGTSK